jgi:Glycine cleavage system protein P (pyridoxal-binding), N-terminal domain
VIRTIDLSGPLTHLNKDLINELENNVPFSKQKSNEFISRHIGPNEAETKSMLTTIGVSSIDDLIYQNSSGVHQNES